MLLIFIKYKGKSLALIDCYCDTELACEFTKSIHIPFNVEDSTGFSVSSVLYSFFKSRGYSDATSEDLIEQEMWEYAKEQFGDVALQNEYEIKSIIQHTMCGNLNIPCPSLFSVPIKDLEEGSWEYDGGICF